MALTPLSEVLAPIRRRLEESRRLGFEYVDRVLGGGSEAEDPANYGDAMSQLVELLASSNDEVRAAAKSRVANWKLESEVERWKEMLSADITVQRIGRRS